MSELYRKKEHEQNLNDLIYTPDDSKIESLSGLEYRKRCRDRWFIAKQDAIISGLILGQTGIAALIATLEALGHSVDDDLNFATIELDRLIREFKEL